MAMKALLRPRLILSLLLGIAAGLLVWLLPPLPSYTARLPNPGSPGFGQPPFVLVSVSSNARYLITRGTHDNSEVDYTTIHVWDRAYGVDKPRFKVKNSWATVFSPDETHLAGFGTMSVEAGVVVPTVFLYDLSSALLLKRWELKCDHMLFSRAGKLRVVVEDVLRDLETGQELRRLPKSIDGFELKQHLFDFAVYRREQHVRLYSWHSGELEATHDLVGNMMGIQNLSRDGKFIGAQGWPPGVGPWTASFMHILLDTSANVHKTSEHRTISGNSPDGLYVAEPGERKRPGWIPRWWPGAESTPTMRFVHWTTDKELAAFAHISYVSFSPDGSQVALMRDDYVIDVYAFPFRKPWGLIAGAALLAACGSWSVGWLGARWRGKAKPAPIPPSVPARA